MVNVSTNGTSASVPVLCGTYGLQIAGTWGGATVQPQQNVDGTNWTNFTKSDGSTLTYSANTVFEVDLMDSSLRYITSGATAATLFATGKPMNSVGSGRSF